ncbi:protein of unknown function (4846) [Anaerovirgula multivorans]|uniref:DUF4846 domain-containing protein n=1 Tax=Anaerovirgula multivorans TaxID=312168 RepID=A0A239JU14_9FIRM|nr:DUF4846 domain-containing protein [Anaerovirgula multivorans]SNT09351.1 protein of unknown function (4846) [Anaerovirgula multivorans]
MRKALVLLLITLQLLSACTDKNIDRNNADHNEKSMVVEESSKLIENIPVEQENIDLLNIEGDIIQVRILPPQNFERIDVIKNTFGDYLRNLPLKPHGSKVIYYDGREKRIDVYEAVIDIDVGDRDLQQCADAVIRLRAEYLYDQGLYDKIHFNFTNGFSADYRKWMEGYRISVNGNNVSWVKRADYSKDYQSFRKYLDIVFAYAGTLSLAQELKKVSIEEMEIGDVFIQGGSPGHCVIVVDIVENKQTGEKLFLLAQSYMPAQDIHILKNPRNKELSPWYSLDFGETLVTPEWTFNRGDLKRF